MNEECEICDYPIEECDCVKCLCCGKKTRFDRIEFCYHCYRTIPAVAQDTITELNRKLVNSGVELIQWKTTNPA